MWSPPFIKLLAQAISLGHVTNENKRAALSPSAVREVWAYWDDRDSFPKKVRLALFFGSRPGRPEAPEKPSDPFVSLDKMKARSALFWREALGLKQIEAGQSVFLSTTALLADPHRRMSLIYRDSRLERPAELERADARLWVARRRTLARAGGETASLLMTLGQAMAYEALPMPSERLSLGQIQRAREKGQLIGISAIGERASEAGASIALKYDFACREAGDSAGGADNAVEASALLQGFFLTLASNQRWATVGGGGEHEALFSLLCRLEKKWQGSLDELAEKQIGVIENLNWSLSIPPALIKA